MLVLSMTKHASVWILFM